jgi:tetratricopeptide (TPR) repeat protein
MTGALWRSAFVAAVFAIHPLRVESVAWIAERKDVLAAFFFMLTLGAYVRYVRGPSTLRYLAIVAVFALGLLAKNMLVTLPFVLLLLDYWPLERMQNTASRKLSVQSIRPLLIEKLPFFALALASCVATLLVPEEVAPADRLPFWLRIGNAIVSHTAYLGQMLWPKGLAVPYPNPTAGIPLWHVALSFCLLLAITILVVASRKTRPYLAVGWFWFLGMLVPVIGIIQISYYARADRYTYLPQVGVLIALTWLVADLFAAWHRRRVVLAVAAITIIAVLASLASRQTSHWRDSESLWNHTLACTTNNAVAHYNLGRMLLQSGRLDEAIQQFRKTLEIDPHSVKAHNDYGAALLRLDRVNEAMARFRRALELDPNYPDAHNNLGSALLQSGRVDEALVCFQKTLEIEPDYAPAHVNLGIAHLRRGNVDAAISHYRSALKITPDSADVHNNIGIAFRQSAQLPDAIAHFQQALKIRPDFSEAQNNLGNTLLQSNRAAEAIANYETALERDPDFVPALNNLAWVLATSSETKLRNGPKAVALAEQANQLSGKGNAAIGRTLAAAYAESGRFDDAIRVAVATIDLANSNGESTIALQVGEHLKFYRQRLPFHQDAKVR